MKKSDSTQVGPLAEQEEGLLVRASNDFLLDHLNGRDIKRIFHFMHIRPSRYFWLRVKGYPDRLAVDAHKFQDLFSDVAQNSSNLSDGTERNMSQLRPTPGRRSRRKGRYSALIVVLIFLLIVCVFAFASVIGLIVLCAQSALECPSINFNIGPGRRN